MESLFIDDNYTQTRTIPAVSGLHPDLTIVFRPALSKERVAYQAKSRSLDPTVLDLHETTLIEKYLVSVNGKAFEKAEIVKLKPTVRGYILDLVLGYVPADEATDAKN